MANNALFEPAFGVPAVGPQNALGAAPPSMADAYEYHAQALQKWMADQRASGVAAGTIDPDTGWPTQKGVLDGVRQWGDAMIGGTSAPGFRAYHASPYSFNAFDTAKIGTGEGAQAFGHGLYVAGDEAVKNNYLRQFEMHPAIQDQRNAWSERVSGLNDQLDTLGTQIDKARRAGDDAAVTELQKQYRPLHDEWSQIQNKAPKPVSYEVQVNADPAHFLDWDKPLSEQTPHVREALTGAGAPTVGSWLPSYASGGALKPGPVTEFGYYGTSGQQGTVRQIDRMGDGNLEWLASYDTLDGRGSQRFPTQQAAQNWIEKSAPIEAGRGADIYQKMRRNNTSDAAISEALKAAGIPGIRYLDGGSRADGSGTSNHVIFDPATIEILRKYGIAGLMAGAGAAAAGTTEQPQ